MSVVTNFANSGIEQDFDVIEVDDPEEDEYNILVKPKSVSANEWLRLLVKPANISRDAQDESNVYSIIVTKPQTDVVLVCVHNGIFLFKDNDIPQNISIIVNLNEFDISAIKNKLEVFYQTTQLIAQ